MMHIRTMLVKGKPYLTRVDYNVLGIKNSFVAYTSTDYRNVGNTVKVYWSGGKGFNSLMAAAKERADIINLEVKSPIYWGNGIPKTNLKLVEAVTKAMIFSGGKINVHIKDMGQTFSMKALEKPITDEPLFMRAEIDYKLSKEHLAKDVAEHHKEAWKSLQELRESFIRMYKYPKYYSGITGNFKHEIDLWIAEGFRKYKAEEELKARINILEASGKLEAPTLDNAANKVEYIKAKEQYINRRQSVAMQMSSEEWLSTMGARLENSNMYCLDRINVTPYSDSLSNFFKKSDFIQSTEEEDVEDPVETSASAISNRTRREYDFRSQPSKIAELSIVYDYVVEYAEKLGVVEELAQENRMFCNKCGNTVYLHSEATLWRKYRQVFNQCLYCDSVYPPAEGEVNDTGEELYEDTVYGTDPLESPELVLLAKVLKDLAKDGMSFKELKAIAEEFLS